MNLPVRLGAQSVREKALAAMSRRLMFEVSDMIVVAVSETKPISAILEAHLTTQCHFGENYVSELVRKASDPEILKKCPDIKWHFVGVLEFGKIDRLMTAPNLYAIHAIDSVKLADLVDAAWGKKQKPNPLKVLVQININEDCDTAGISPKESHNLASHILKNCSNLEFHGLMIVRTHNHDPDSDTNPDFKKMLDMKYIMCEEFHIPFERLYLSMGTSHDFEDAIGNGSNYVRVGSAIFGPREKEPWKQDLKRPKASHLR